MSRTNCDHCNALATPGASFCLSCFLPFEDEAPAPAAPAAPPAAAAPAPPAPGYGVPPVPGMPAAAPYGMPAAAPVPAGVGAQGAGAHDFFAPPAPTQFMHHPGEQVDWRATAPVAAMLAQPQRKPKSKAPKVVAGVVGLLVLAGAVFGAKAVLARPSEKEELATAFREARPPDLLPQFPSIGSLLGETDTGEPEAPGQAQAFVQSIDPKVREANAALLGMQQTMDRWADGKVSDDTLRARIKDLNTTLGAVTSVDVTLQAPQSTQRGLGKLNESAMEYRLALGALLDWLDSQTGGARLTYRLTIGDANLHWDEGLINLYRAGGLPPPPLPHPQPKKK